MTNVKQRLAYYVITKQNITYSIPMVINWIFTLFIQHHHSNIIIMYEKRVFKKNKFHFIHVFINPTDMWEGPTMWETPKTVFGLRWWAKHPKFLSSCSLLLAGQRQAIYKYILSAKSGSNMLVRFQRKQMWKGSYDFR